LHRIRHKEQDIRQLGEVQALTNSRNTTVRTPHNTHQLQ